ncbi:MAG: AraC family transcriptional regulator [Planctomycetota bacterium]
MTQPHLNTESPAVAEPDFVSNQVSEARRFYLNMNPPAEKPLTVVCGGVERMREDYHVARQEFPYYAIEWVAEGQGDLHLDERRFLLEPGMMFAYGPRTPHRIAGGDTNRMRKYYVDFAGHDAEQQLEHSGLLAGRPLRITRMHEVIELFASMDREARSDGQLTHDICDLLLRLMFLKIRQRGVPYGTGVPRAYATYEKIRTHIEQNFRTLQTVQEVARACDITPIHLSRLFRRFAGMGAYQYLLKQKMELATELLIREGLLVKEVAKQLGFADAFQFSRAFKRVYGVSPKQMAESHRQDEI